jgi:hypothetical protein
MRRTGRRSGMAAANSINEFSQARVMSYRPPVRYDELRLTQLQLQNHPPGSWAPNAQEGGREEALGYAK